MSISFRPHHFLCTLAFQGKGYSPDFVRNYKAIVKELKASPRQSIIEVTQHTDSICTPCPNKVDLLCKTQEKIQTLDKEHARVLALQAGDKFTWSQAKDRIKERMTLEEFHKICEPCSWKALGLCEEVLTQFLAEEK